MLAPDATPSLECLTISTIQKHFAEVFPNLFPSTGDRLSTLLVRFYREDTLHHMKHMFDNVTCARIPLGRFSDQYTFLSTTSRNKQLSIIVHDDCLREEGNASEGFPRLCGMLGGMPNLEALRLEVSINIKSHASITPMQAWNLCFVLHNLAAACCRLNYIQIDTLAWRILPKIRHSKEQPVLLKNLTTGKQI